MEDDSGLSEFGRAALAYVEEGFAVIPLHVRAKEPLTENGLDDWTNDPDVVRAWWGRFPFANIGIVCGAPSGGLVVLDLDQPHGDTVADGYETLRAWEREHEELPVTCAAVTGRGGYHLLYRADGEVRPSVNVDLAVDVRGDGSYIVAPPSVHPNGNRYEWETPPDEIRPARADGSVMAFVASVRRQSGGEAFEMPAEVGEGGRNDMLFRAGCSMRAKGLEPDVIADALRGINATRCRPPLPAEEVAKVAESVMARPSGHSAEFDAKVAAEGGPRKKGAEAVPEAAQGAGGAPAWLDHKGRLLHNVFAQELIEQDGACRVGTAEGMPAIWDGARYATGWTAVDRAVTARYDAARMRDRSEVRDYLRCMAPVRQEAPANLIAFNNGVFDIERGEFVEAGRDVLITNVIPHDLDLDAVCPAVDELLARVSLCDQTMMVNLYELIGVCMYRSSALSQAVVMLGEGSNGKSTVLKMIKALLGGENYSTLDLGDFGRPFQLGQLAGKLANIGDDISNEFQNGDVLAQFKKVASGEDVYTDVKNATGYHFRPYCTLVFSANEFPKLGDQSEGVMRRLFPLEFRARFTRGQPGYDPNVIRKVTSPEACRYLAKLGIVGLDSALGNGGFTPNEASDRVREEIRAENDTVLQWVQDEGHTAEELDGTAISDAYALYSRWSAANGLMAVGRQKFTRRANAALGTVSAAEHPGGNQKTVRVLRRAQ